MVEHMAEAVKSIKEQERILQLSSTTDDQFGKILSENFCYILLNNFDMLIQYYSPLCRKSLSCSVPCDRIPEN